MENPPKIEKKNNISPNKFTTLKEIFSKIKGEKLSGIDSQKKQNHNLEQAADFLSRYPDPVVFSLEDRRDSALEVNELKSMIENFTTLHSIDKLSCIVNLTPVEALADTERQTAIFDLKNIFNKLKILKNETNIEDTEYQELKLKHTEFSNAIGIINNNIVDHTRFK